MRKRAQRSRRMGATARRGNLRCLARGRTLRRRAFVDVECAALHLASAIQLRPLERRSAFCARAVGPMVAPIIMLSAVQDANVVCTLIQSANGCTGLKNYWTLPTGTPWPGALYAPFVMDRSTQDVTPPGPGEPKRATIYWLLSTWNPYVVVVMQSTLELKP
jgi:hypothetical protein